MSEPTDQNQSDTMDDKDLSALYARGSNEQPTADLDQVILDKARKATAQPTTRSKDSSWSQVISMAAVLVVSVTVVMLVHKEAPQPLSDTRQLATVQEEKTMPAPAITPTPQPAKQLLGNQKEEIAPAESRIAPMDLQDRLALLKKEAKVQRQTRAKGQVQDKTIATSPALAFNKKTLTQKAPALKAPVTKSPVQESITAETMAAGAVSRNTMGLTHEGKSCSQLTEQECFTSAACTLTKNKDGQDYLCRPAKDHCELMFRQSEGTKQSCETKAGCVYVPANCYCQPGIECRCSGGEPAQCRGTTQRQDQK